MIKLTTQQRQKLRAHAHSLKPVIRIGNKGLTPAVQAEINQALAHHELIKLRLSAPTRELRQAMLQEICTTQEAENIQLIGHIGTIFRLNPEKKPQKA